MFYSTDPVNTETESQLDGHAQPDTSVDQRELDVLSVVHAASPDDGDATGKKDTPASHLSQRSIANALGMSVGLTNAILKRLTDKGFVMMRRINHNNVHYLVTPDGIDQISRRSYLYLRRTIGNVVRYKERLRAFCHTTREQGVREIILVGESDLTFILEWCAQKAGLTFRQVGSAGEVEGFGVEEADASLEPVQNSGKSHPDRGAVGGIAYSGEGQPGENRTGLEERDQPRTHGDGIVPRTPSSGTTLNRAATTAERCRDQATRPGSLIVLSEHTQETDRPNVVLLHRVVLGLPDR
jgi:DNA-binding MarR family transcriptional regulator